MKPIYIAILFIHAASFAPAEEQAKKMATDAAQDAIRVRETAKAESEQLGC